MGAAQPQRAERARLYLVSYALQNGARGTLHVIAAHGCEAIGIAQELFGTSLRRCSARPA